MTLDGKIATASGESKWITGEKARAHGMKLRQGSDAILVGINTILADDPSLTVRVRSAERFGTCRLEDRTLRDCGASFWIRLARTPLNAKVVSDEFAGADDDCREQTRAEKSRGGVGETRECVVAPLVKNSSPATRHPSLDLRWLLKKLGAENVTSLLVEGGGEVNASFLLGGFAQRVAFFYAPKILGGRDSRKAVAGEGAEKSGGGDSASRRRMEAARPGFVADGAGLSQRHLGRVPPF